MSFLDKDILTDVKLGKDGKSYDLSGLASAGLAAAGKFLGNVSS
jgi:hypothetical protein